MSSRGLKFSLKSDAQGLESEVRTLLFDVGQRLSL
jgi:hypothetical protein